MAASSGWWTGITGTRPWLDAVLKSLVVGVVSFVFPDDDLRHRLAFAVLTATAFGAVVYLGARPLRREHEAVALGAAAVAVLVILFAGGLDPTNARATASGVALMLTLPGMLLWTSRSTARKLERASSGDGS